MSSLTYNNIELGYISTQQVEQEVIFDASGVDYLFTHITIKVHCIFNTALVPAEGDESPAEIMKRVRKCLLQERKILNYSTEAQFILSGPNDAFHGPLPKYCDFVPQGTECFWVEYAIETWLVECCTDAPAPYLSNRWKEHHTIDKLGYTTRTINGMVRFPSTGVDTKTFGQNGEVKSADEWRGMILPPGLVIPGSKTSSFRREKQDYETSEDGLTWTYTIVDQEYYTNPPPGLMDIEGSHTVDCSNGAVYKEHITIVGKGNPTTPKAAVLALAMSVLFQRLQLIDDKKKFVISGYTKDIINENTVEVSASTLKQLQGITAKGLNVGLANQKSKLDYIMGDKFGLNPPQVKDRGTADLHMLKLALYLQRCVPYSYSAALAQPANNNNITVTVVPNSATNVPAAIPSQPTIVKQNQIGIYTDFQMETEYHNDQHIAQLPRMSSSITIAAIINLAQATYTKVVKWTAERLGQWPQMPEPVTNNPNEILLHARTKPVNVTNAPDGLTKIYTVHGNYVYAIKDFSKVQKYAGVAPYNTTPYSETQVPPQQFVQGIGDSGTVPQG